MNRHRSIEWPTGHEPRSSAARGRVRGAAPSLEQALLRWLLKRLGRPALGFELWDGSSVAASCEPPVATVSIRDRAALWRLLADPGYQFGELYSAGRIEVGGDLVGLIELVNRASSSRPRRGLTRWLRPTRANSRTGSRRNIHRHYDLGNDFYRLWLDQELLYTCAYFESPGQTLEQAQRAKMEHVCRKLELAPGQRVAEAGSGWGSLAIYMARHHGVRVRSYNISRRQIEHAQQRQRAEGVPGVEFVEDDYRNMRGEYDVFVSVGMLEHVGRQHYRELGAVIDRVLTPDGRALIHTIGRSVPRPLNPWIERRIFPGAYPPTLREMMAIFEPYDLAVLDVENLRLHYAATLRHWLARYDAAEERVRELFDQRFVRAWRLYLSGSVAAFVTGNLHLFQVVVNRSMSNRVPMTREHLYRTTGVPR